jgi:hypothetical protein
LILPKLDVAIEHPLPAPTDARKTHRSSRSASDNCARIRDLGFRASKHIKLYGEDFELVSDPFVEGDYTTVHAFSRSDPEVRELRLPTSILVGLPDLFRQRAKLEEPTWVCTGRPTSAHCRSQRRRGAICLHDSSRRTWNSADWGSVSVLVGTPEVDPATRSTMPGSWTDLSGLATLPSRRSRPRPWRVALCRPLRDHWAPSRKRPLRLPGTH